MKSERSRRQAEEALLGGRSPAGLPPVERRTFGHAVSRALDAVPDKVAQREGGRSWTYAQAYERALALAGGLRAQGAERGQPVALMLDNSLDFVHLWSGMSLTGVIEVPVNTSYKGDFLLHVLEDSRAELLVVDERYVKRIAAIADDITTLRRVIVRGGSGAALGGASLEVLPFEQLLQADSAGPVAVQPDELIAYMYTSGTTGRAKGVEITHAHAYTYSSAEDRPHPHGDDCLLVNLPLFHLGAQGLAYQALIARASFVLQQSFSVRAFWPTVRENGITFCLLLGGMAEMLQQQAPRADDAHNPLRLVAMGPLPTDLDGFRERFGVQVLPVFGMSEIGTVMVGAPDEVVPGEAGRLREGYQLRIVDEEGRDVPDGAVGELLVRGIVPHTTMRGYHGLPEKTAETVIDGWVHTGDGFRRDERGHYFFVDRMKDALRRRGENVSSFEVERVINTHPQVLDSAVVAVPSELAEDEIKAVIVPREDAHIDPRELTAYLVERLPYFMVPRYLAFADDLPRTPTQKVQKHRLRAGGIVNAWDREAAGIRLRRGD